MLTLIVALVLIKGIAPMITRRRRTAALKARLEDSGHDGGTLSSPSVPPADSAAKWRHPSTPPDPRMTKDVPPRDSSPPDDSRPPGKLGNEADENGEPPLDDRADDDDEPGRGDADG